MTASLLLGYSHFGRAGALVDDGRVREQSRSERVVTAEGSSVGHWLLLLFRRVLVVVVVVVGVIRGLLLFRRVLVVVVVVVVIRGTVIGIFLGFVLAQVFPVPVRQHSWYY